MELSVQHINQSADDNSLLIAYQESLDQNILATLFLRYNDLIFGTCMKYLKDEDASQDAVMDIYQELVQKLPQHKVENFKSWLYVVTKNHCLMQLRKDKKTPTVEFDGQFMQSEDFSHLDNVLEKEKHLQSLESCIEALNDEQKKSIQLFYLENKCYNEIADITGIEWNKVRSLIQNGRRNLKICMEKNG
ncbi:MAG: sigma-70 family RNA polymerase sigma factor [Chitinophagaceae bacterium]|nr:sigma-70 family RNA polymerase sigma factor [Chitinophagaceae bacterium]MCW5903984.1 sigma-70 family RNA polymerase sigma factor [Chitinophagaceae bacterium]